MRRHRKFRQAEVAEADLTPMLDVVFILLIFFIVTATFNRETALGLEPPPPRASSADAQATTIIDIDMDNLVRIDGRLTEVGLVTPRLQRIAAEAPDTPVMIIAHPKARSGKIILVRDQVENANVAKVNLTLSDTQ